VNGTARESFRPAILVDPAEPGPNGDPAMDAVLRVLEAR
jgi:hypothetical protein